MPRIFDLRERVAERQTLGGDDGTAEFQAAEDGVEHVRVFESVENAVKFRLNIAASGCLASNGYGISKSSTESTLTSVNSSMGAFSR